MRCKSLMSILFVLILIMGTVFAEESAEPAATVEPEMTSLEIALNGRITGGEPTHITVGNSTKVNGAFFSSQFGNNTSDIDVRAMLHGYNPIVWDTQLTFVVDEQVVSNLSKTTDRNGDAVYTFTIYDDLTWNDGTPITARDYVFGYALQCSPQFDEISGDTDVWTHIVGYEEYFSGESDIYAGIRLLGDYRFSVTVKKEYLPYFYEYSYLYIMPSPISVIAPGCEVADDGNGVYIRNIDETMEDPIFTADLLRETILNPETGYLSHPYLTCGPYSLVSYDAASGTVEFTINEYYKGNYEGVKPVITNVTLVPVLPQEMVQKLESGEIDLINKVVDGDTIIELRNLASNGGYDVSNYARLGYGFIGLACEQGPQQFVAVRQAIAYAFDSEDYVRTMLKGFGLTVQSYYGLGQWMTLAALSNLRPVSLTEEEEAIWDSFSLDELNPYSYDVDKALQLLIDDGWTLNKKGEEYDPETDKVRYKLVDGELMALSFDFALTKDNLAAQDVLARLKEALEPLGAEFVVSEIPFTAVLSDYLREDGTRKYDMSFLATNFVPIFDPLVEFASDPNAPGTQNATGVYDEELIRLAWELHTIENGDLVGFELKWIEWQTRFNEILPSIPIYSNVYFDFYSSNLHNYYPEAEANWPRAVLYAYWSETEAEETGDVTEEVLEEEEFEESEDDGDLIIIE